MIGSDFISDKDFIKNEWYSLKDVLISKNRIYVSYTNEKETDCYNTSLLVANLNYDELKFQELFNPDECVKILNVDKVFNAHQSGGRIYEYKDPFLLLTIGDYRLRSTAQDLTSVFGKLLRIHESSGEHDIISVGHRNPQGLHYDDKNDLIILTEHGPAGGDEININLNPDIKIKNFGWPISSYGKHYSDGNKITYEKYPLLKSHSDFGFEEPAKYFVPSIGISEITKVDKKIYS